MIAIYLAETSKNCASAHIYPDERAKYIVNASDKRVKIQRYSVWKLLELAVRDCYNLSLEELKFSLGNNGKWSCDKLHFSLSHCDGTVAVALSDSSVGVDIESCSSFEKRCKNSPSFVQSFAQKILAKDEECATNGDLLKLWTGKESIYKFAGGNAFAPDKLRVADYPVSAYGYGDFCISVCGLSSDRAQFFACEEIAGSYVKGGRFFPIEMI